MQIINIQNTDSVPVEIASLPIKDNVTGKLIEAIIKDILHIQFDMKNNENIINPINNATSCLSVPIRIIFVKK